MGGQFTAGEVLDMAVRIERNGREFYKKAAGMVADTETSALLERLAEWEGGHEERFTAMKAELSEMETVPTAIDPYGESALYLEAMADDHVFLAGRTEPGEEVAGKDDLEILDMALDFEKASILFFTGLVRLVSPGMGKDKVYQVIDEEVGHIAYLEDRKRKLS